MVLYKYYSPNNNAYKSLAARGLFCNLSKKMNDPFECLALIEREFSKREIEELIDYFKRSSNFSLNKISRLKSNDIISEFLNTLRKKLIESYAFCALSESYDNVLMWAHYADGHKGFVLGVDLDVTHRNIHQVEYVKTLPKIDPKDYSMMLENNESEMVDFFLKDLTFKSNDWSYEKEWRIWRKNPCYFHYQPEQIREVIFGLNTDFETKNIVIELTNYLGDKFLYKELEVDQNNLSLSF